MTMKFRENMHIISAVGLFCCDEFEETPNEKVSDLSKLTKPYFNTLYLSYNLPLNKQVAKGDDDVGLMRAKTKKKPIVISFISFILGIWKKREILNDFFQNRDILQGVTVKSVHLY